MRKTTDELCDEADAELRNEPFNGVAIWLDTFRRLAIENERDAVIEECAKVVAAKVEEHNKDSDELDCQECSTYGDYAWSANDCLQAIRALKSQPATPDPRDEALRIAKEALEDAHQNINPERGFADEVERDIEKALAAIDKVMKGGE